MYGSSRRWLRESGPVWRGRQPSSSVGCQTRREFVALGGTGPAFIARGPTFVLRASYAGARTRARNPPARTLPEQRYRRLPSRKRCKECRFQVAGVKETMIDGVWSDEVPGASSPEGLPVPI